MLMKAHAHMAIEHENVTVTHAHIAVFRACDRFSNLNNCELL